MIAVIKSNGNKVTGKTATVFVRIGIAEELKEIEPIPAKSVVITKETPKEQLKVKPVAKAKSVKKSKRGRPAKK